MQLAIVASILLVVPALVEFLYTLLLRYLSARRGKPCQTACPAGPVKDKIFGLDFIYNIIFRKSDENYLASTCRLFKQFGSTYTMKSCFWQTIFTSDSQNIKHILATSFNDFELPKLRRDAISTLLGTGIFSVNGASWSHARSLLRPSFAKRDKSAITAMLEDHFQSFLRHVPRNEEAVDLQPLFFALTMDFASQFLTSKSSHMLDETRSHDKEWQFFEDYTTCSEEVIKKMCLGPLQIFRYNRAAEKAKRRVFKYMDGFIDEALRSADSKEAKEDNVLTKLAEVTPDRKMLRDQMLHLLVASRDTTASLLCNLFFMLAKEPEMYKTLRQEVLSVCGDAPPLPDQLKQMKYLCWCVQESLRLHPVIPTNAREATRDTTLPVGGGKDGSEPLLVRKGTLIVYNVFALHRDEAVFGADATKFRPGRWAGLRPGWGYLPFNGGPRICLGQQMALLESQYLVARMVQTFQTMASQESRDWEELFALATTCKHGVKVRMKWA
ncbi:Cytochrome P450 CYP584D4 [Beauveria bassiana ARSEF 2860]|uniref:Cytochrome P450 CYP584D4 n=1 Tax=Beauveria bassiana (strain ARSEF 2860) TaxID=655819 RepID=J4KNA3_BEAB2|nr:Cytochrome P450 CYP584D4 [Beauveria bassiana ARSEF 2860]EJP65354.1 Cytochrome P450 CYP584D4 [Beauveria bassiana ARSEF 2860]